MCPYPCILITNDGDATKPMDICPWDDCAIWVELKE